MEWGLVKKRVLESVRELAEAGPRRQDWADALEQCLALAAEVHRTREVDAELRDQLDRAQRSATAMRAVLLTTEASYCRCDAKTGRVCGIHALVGKALEGEDAVN